MTKCRHHHTADRIYFVITELCFESIVEIINRRKRFNGVSVFA